MALQTELVFQYSALLENEDRIQENWSPASSYLLRLFNITSLTQNCNNTPMRLLKHHPRDFWTFFITLAHFENFNSSHDACENTHT